MNTKRLTSRSLLMVGYLGLIMVMLACAVFSGAQMSDNGLFRLDNNTVQVQDDNGDWVAVGGASFELVGKLESTDPWTVAGTTLETRDITQIDEGLEVGALVRVRGIILEDKTWVAYSIELVDEQTEPIIVLIGTVDSIDPWVVNSISLNVTADTDIQGDITTGMIVRVEIQLAPDGTWNVISITLLGDVTETSGCATVIATVVSVNGDEIQFLGWPSTVIFKSAAQTENTNANENGEEDNNDQGEDTNGSTSDIIVINADQVVQAVVCVSGNGQLVIVQIIILNGSENDGGTSVDNGEKVLVCHKPNKNGGHTLSLPQSAVPAHLGHGDKLGACP
jgi:uncharacterized protein DUF5666